MREAASWFKELCDAGPVVMGVLNVTPDSCSDGGQFLGAEKAVAQAKTMLAAGAQIIDVGGESSRPGAEPVSEAAELARVLPVIQALASIEGIRISVDTYKPAVMEAACQAGAHMVNDIYALRQPGAMEVVQRLGVPVCLMHMQGQPKTMQNQPTYSATHHARAALTEELPAVVAEVAAFLFERIDACRRAGVPAERLCVDPGFGFGKTLADNLHLMRHLAQFAIAGCPVLVGVSRKSMIGHLLGKPVSDRLAGGLALAFRALDIGAQVIRTHDVAETVDCVRIWQALAQDPESFRDHSR